MFKIQFTIYSDMVEKFLEELPWGEDVLSQSMRYSLVGGGKRIRPVLALACCEVVGGNSGEIVRFASALELIHTYSLIHDDLPAMDNDDYRRGKLSNHKVFGEGKAILAGDALLTYAFELLAGESKLPPELRLRVIREVALAAGPTGMVGGQVLDLEGEGKKLDLSEIEQIHQAKTGAMLIVSARMGAILGKGTEQEIEQLTRYAKAIGLAFQIKDDILDIEGDSATLGKPAQSDLRQEKSTYPSLLGLEGAKTHLNRQIAEAKEAVKIFGMRAEFLSCLADYIALRQH
ncbi:MAG: polyprenyl synthetase family protein [Desulfitobacterium hafniense]|nr:polyprenyl synthetase family protein [Desulfitobacterium hafniense]